MTTAFQSGAFQSDAFQIWGGDAGAPAPAPESRVVPAGRSRRHRPRYVARHRGEDYEFSSLADLEEFVAEAREEQASLPKKHREPVRIKLSPDFESEIEPDIEIPRRLYWMPTNAAMAQIRKIDFSLGKILADARRAIDEDDEEVMLWLLH